MILLKAIYCTIYLGCAFLLFIVGIVVQPAMAQIVPSTQQSAAQSANIFGTVTQADGRSIAGADVRLNGPAMVSVKSDVHGLFVFTGVPFGVYEITVISTLGTASRSNIVVRGDVNVAVQYQADVGGLKVIAQTTTHINITPANIASVSPSDYAFEGNASWRQLLDKIPGVTVGGLVSGGASTYDSIPNSPLQPIILSINGTLPYETSTMLDGMPLQGTSATVQYSNAGGGVDLSVLPLNAFSTADIVRGPGGDSPSIVDSIGGTFVLHAPNQVDTNQFEFSVSNDPYGGIVSNAKAAVRFGRLSTTVVYGLNNSPGPFGTESILSGHTVKPLTVNGQTFQNCTAPANCFSIIPSTSTYQNCYCTINDSLLLCCIQANTNWVQHNGAISLAYAIGSSVTAQIFYAGSSSRTYGPAVIFPVNFTPGSGYSGNLTPGRYNLINTQAPSLEGQGASLLEERVTAYAGHGVLHLSALQYNSFDNSIVSSGFPNGQYTLYGTGFVGPTPPGTTVVFNGTPANVTFPAFTLNYTTWTNDRDLLFSYTTQLGLASSAGISYTTSYYNEPYIFDLLSGTSIIDCEQPPSISDTTKELHVSFNTELSSKLSLTASWYSTISTFHVPNPTNPLLNTDSIFRYSAPRVGAAWHVQRNTTIRFAAGGGYALPQLFNLVGIQSIFSNDSTSYGMCAPNLNLQPEKSFGMDLGVDTRLSHDTVLSFDVYHTNLYGQIFNSTQLTGTFAGLPLYTTQYQNLAESRFEGLNLDIHHDPARGFYWRAAIGLMRAYVVSVPPGFYDDPTQPCTNCANTYIVPGINFDGKYQSTVPYANGTGWIGYRWSSEKYVDLAPTYYGNNNAYFEPAFLEFDAHASYPLTRQITLLANFRNITGIYGQNYERLAPSVGAPTISGMPGALFGIPYGPRSIVLTLNYKS